MSYEIAGADIVIIAIMVLGLGYLVTERLPLLKRLNIPIPVVGGLLCSLVVASLGLFGDIDISFDMRLRDLLLLVFFSTIGLSAKIHSLLAGGRALILLLILATVFLFVQDFTGVTLAMLFGAHPGYGLFAGSISFAGGHGTAIAWGEVAQESGLDNAAEIGIAFATFGLIAGGIIGGPIAGRLISKLPDDAAGESTDQGADGAQDNPQRGPLLLPDILGTILMLAVCVSLGDIVNRALFAQGVLLPGFLTAMVVGIVITNIREFAHRPVNADAIDTVADISLNLFLAISLMSMDVASLTTSAGPILVGIFVQMLVITIFATLIVFRVMGRDYDAAVIAGGFVGLGLGATPVAIANMHAITTKYKPSPKAMLVVPLVGAFFIDIVNSLVIKFFLAAPVMQHGAS
ncbi:MAG: sodium/glutamate symporter [Planctomycetota bacterium]